MAGFLRNYYDTGKKVLLKPVEFFREMPTTGGYKDPLIFAIITAVIMGVGLTAITLGVGFLAILFAPIAVAISIFLAALLLLVCAKIVGGTGTYEATLRVAAYANIVNIIGWIPIVSVLGSIYGLVLTIIGMKEIHSLSTVKAIIAVGIAIAIVFIIVVLLAIIGIGITGYVPAG
ncbi:YIP1 family protein [bacterium]|nr:YIP1 family protein [bacterium]